MIGCVLLSPAQICCKTHSSYCLSCYLMDECSVPLPSHAERACDEEDVAYPTAVHPPPSFHLQMSALSALPCTDVITFSSVIITHHLMAPAISPQQCFWSLYGHLVAVGLLVTNPSACRLHAGMNLLLRLRSLAQEKPEEFMISPIFP